MKTCLTRKCNNKVSGHHSRCPKHELRLKKKKNLFLYTYDILKCNAKRRKKEFTLTREEFKIFCDKTNYLKLKGRKSDSYSIDRIDNNKGYSLDNIQILSFSLNSSKQDCPF